MSFRPDVIVVDLSSTDVERSSKPGPSGSQYPAHDLYLVEETRPLRSPRSSSGRIAERRVPLALAGISLVVGMVFMFAWNPVVAHSRIWYMGDDVWGIYRGAHFITWGYVGGIYEQSNGIVSFPGMPVLLAPVAMLTSALHLSESFPPFILARPTAALILQPVELLLASSVIFSCDALSERLNLARGRRAWLCLIVGVFAWPPAALWGHAEDVLAVTFAMYALIAMIDRKWTKCGWLLGCGIVLQPLVGLLLPLVLAVSPSGKRIALGVRATSISAILLALAFIGDRTDTYRSVITQPTPPTLNHPTPWLALARSLGAVDKSHLVSAGPVRSIDLVVALLVGLCALRLRPLSLSTILWLAAMVLCSRCFFEAVMTPYYLAPPLILAVVVAARQPAHRFFAAGGMAIAVTVFSYRDLSPWVWWSPVVVAMAVMLAVGYPGRARLGAPAETPCVAEPKGVPVQHVLVPN